MLSSVLEVSTAGTCSAGVTFSGPLRRTPYVISQSVRIMQVKSLFLALTISGLLLGGCSESQEDRDELAVANDISEALEEARQDMKSALDDAREEIADAREQVRDARENLRDRDDDWDGSNEHLKDALKSLGSAIKELGSAISEDSGPDPVDYRKLKDLLPGDVASMERYESEGSRKGALGIKLSMVEGRYEGTDREMEVKIVDLGTLSGLASSGRDFIDAEYDRSDGHGFERTTRYEGHPAFMRIGRDDGRKVVEAVVLIEDRFVVSVKIRGRNIDQDDLDEVMDEIQLSRLTRWAQRSS